MRRWDGEGEEVRRGHLNRSERHYKPWVESSVIVEKDRAEFFDTADVKAGTSGTALAVCVEAEAAIDFPPRCYTAYCPLAPISFHLPSTASKEKVNMVYLNTRKTEAERREIPDDDPLLTCRASSSPRIRKQRHSNCSRRPGASKTTH